MSQGNANDFFGFTWLSPTAASELTPASEQRFEPFLSAMDVWRLFGCA
jgi:hypothetical protein